MKSSPPFWSSLAISWIDDILEASCRLLVFCWLRIPAVAAALLSSLELVYYCFLDFETSLGLRLLPGVVLEFNFFLVQTLLF